MSRDRERNIRNRKSKRVILIAYEGNNKTEKIYFDNFLDRQKDYVIKVVPGNETDPVNLVNQTIQRVKNLSLDLFDDDKAYCVIDTDTDPEKNRQIKEAVEIANQNNIVVITSAPCIELWFLLHYEYTTATINNNEVIKRLKKYYDKYQKNCNIYPTIKYKTNLAIENAKKIEKFQIENNKDIKSVEANPHTEIYKIVEELK